MAGPGQVDTSSPFFSSIAGQAALQGGARAHEGKKKDKDKPGVRRFDRLVRDELAGPEKEEAAFIPPSLAGLPPEKILEALMDDVHSRGDTLKERQTPETILAYKNAVQSFVRYVVDRAFDVSETTSGGNILKRKKFFQVRVIDEKLEQMAAGILSGQRNQLSLLGRIEEINGLLVDLMS